MLNHLYDDKNKNQHDRNLNKDPPDVASSHNSSTNDHDHTDDTKTRFLVRSSITRLFRINAEPTRNLSSYLILKKLLKLNYIPRTYYITTYSRS